jgi:hypothetical protein
MASLPVPAPGIWWCLLHLDPAAGAGGAADHPGRPRHPGADIEATAPQALIYGWMLQFLYAVVPYFAARWLLRDERARLGGNWLSLVTVNLGGVLIWASIFLIDVRGPLHAAGYVLFWSLSLLTARRAVGDRCGCDHAGRAAPWRSITGGENTMNQQTMIEHLNEAAPPPTIPSARVKLMRWATRAWRCSWRIWCATRAVIRKKLNACCETGHCRPTFGAAGCVRRLRSFSIPVRRSHPCLQIFTRSLSISRLPCC